ncbi:hypothetical protein RB597_007494 [Gaeumannomyces tritici]
MFCGPFWKQPGKRHSRSKRRATRRPRDGESPRMPRYYEPRRELLRATCRETLQVAGDHLQRLQRTAAARQWHKYSLATLPPLSPRLCPNFAQPATVRVVNEDTLNAGISLVSQHASAAASALAPTSGALTPAAPDPGVAVMIFGNRHSPGGGWRNGAVAQEEAVCYRSSLALSLEDAQYPLDRSEGVFSPYVLVVRQDMARGGHRLMPGPAEDLPVVSAVTVCAIFKPEISTVPVAHGSSSSSGSRAQAEQSSRRPAQQQDIQSSPAGRQPSTWSFRSWGWVGGGSSGGHSRGTSGGGGGGGGSGGGGEASDRRAESRTTGGAATREKPIFALGRDRHYTKEKMRLALRMAASHGKRSLVLGAFGCGVYANPPEDVAQCWLEVLQDDEFRLPGNWWRDVCFAVYDPRGEGNYEVFKRVLHGQQV